MKLYLADTEKIHIRELADAMKLYLANGSGDIIGRLGDVSERRCRILISYHYFKNADLDELLGRFAVKPKVFADSGAYSAQSLGASIDLQDYARWIKQWSHYFTTYANLDVIGDPDATDVNQRLLEEAGYEPLPAFHIGEPWHYLEDLVQRYPYIGLGGMVGFGSAPMKWLVKCFQIASKAGAVFRGYGVNSVPVLKQLPFYSADATSWGAGFTWGRLPLWDGRKMNSAQMGSKKSIYAFSRLIRDYGYSPEEFARKENQDRTRVIGISAQSYQSLEQYCTSRHGDIQLPATRTTQDRETV